MNHIFEIQEEHNNILLKHESCIKEMMTLGTYLTRNETFLKEVDMRVENALISFNQNLIMVLKEKVNIEDFNRRIREKASLTELSGLQLEITSLKDQVKVMRQIVEK